VDIRPCDSSDYQEFCTIYNHYIENTVITFEEVPITVSDMAGRVEKVTGQGQPWLVAELNGAVIGYAYASQWHERSAFRNTVETAVYLKPGITGKGYGRALYGELLSQSRCHVAVATIVAPNVASERLQEACGFRQVGYLHEVGFKFGRWLDVTYWQKTYV